MLYIKINFHGIQSSKLKVQFKLTLKSNFYLLF
jgi:hypothetical protein